METQTRTARWADRDRRSEKGADKTGARDKDTHQGTKDKDQRSGAHGRGSESSSPRGSEAWAGATCRQRDSRTHGHTYTRRETAGLGHPSGPQPPRRAERRPPAGGALAALCDPPRAPGGGRGGRRGLRERGPRVAFISRRGRRPGQRRAPATPRPRPQLADPTPLAPGRSLPHELCAGRDSLPPAPGTPAQVVGPCTLRWPPAAATLKTNGRAGACAPPHRSRQPIRDPRLLVPLPPSRAAETWRPRSRRAKGTAIGTAGQSRGLRPPGLLPRTSR